MSLEFKRRYHQKCIYNIFFYREYQGKIIIVDNNRALLEITIEKLDKNYNTIKRTTTRVYKSLEHAKKKVAEIYNNT